MRDPDKPIVLAIARPVEKKNLTRLVRAYGRCADLQGRANLVILPGRRRSIGCGEPEQVAVMQSLVDAIDRYDLHGRVAYPRRHSAALVRGLYALARQSRGVFVNPALTEPFGLTILEAAVHGLPVVATRNGGPPDIVAEIGHGVLIDPENSAAMATEIREQLTDRRRWDLHSERGRTNIAAGAGKGMRCISWRSRGRCL